MVKSVVKDKKQPRRMLILRGFFMVGLAGFEPADEGVKVLCLTTWRQPNEKSELKGGLNSLLHNGVGDGARTHDTQNHNLVLYQLNYTHHIWCARRDSNPWPTA